MGPRLRLGDALFSGVQQRVLAVIFGMPERSFYRNELLQLTRSGKGAMQRELERLEKSGLVTVRAQGNQRHYQANSAAPIFEELHGIVVKTFGVADVLRQYLAPLAERIQAAFIYGSIAKRAETAASDVDLLVVSASVGYQDVIEALQPAEKKIGRKINPTVYKPAELRRKRAERSSFVVRVLQQPKIFLIGSDAELE
jgi:predicted nucleotidyltransferase